MVVMGGYFSKDMLYLILNIALENCMMPYRVCQFDII